MNKVAILFLPWLFSAFAYKAVAQEDNKSKKEKQETEEIIIRKKGEKDTKIVIEMKGDKVMINGKPLMEFNEDGITINKRKMIIRDGDNFKLLGPDGQSNFSWSDGGGKSRAFLGVVTEKNEKGALITEITEETAADKAGLKKDDIITKVNDTKIDGPDALSKAIKTHKPNEEVKIHFIRDGKDKSEKVKLGEKKENVRAYSFSSPDGYNSLTIPDAPDMYGLSDQLSELRELEMFGNRGEGQRYDFGFPRRQKLGLKIQDTEDGNGVKILEVADSSAAALAGLKKDDVITEIAGKKVLNTDEAREQLADNAEKFKYDIKIRRNGTDMNFEVKFPKKLKTANL